MKRVAVLLYPEFSNYEMSVPISIMGQAEKPFDVFGLTLEPIKSEENIYVIPQMTLEQLQIENYDGLLLTGSMNPEFFLEDDRYLNFVKAFDSPEMIIGSISSSTAMLARLGMLKGRKYMSGIPEEYLEELGFEKENWINDRNVVRDGNIITAMGFGFIEFGIEFGRALNLKFHPGWYGVDRKPE